MGHLAGSPLLAALLSPPSDPPRLSSPPPAGIFFWWELGCLLYLHRHFDLSKVQLVGASAGGLIATLAACGVDEDKAVSGLAGGGQAVGVDGQEDSEQRGRSARDWTASAAHGRRSSRAWAAKARDAGGGGCVVVCDCIWPTDSAGLACPRWLPGLLQVRVAFRLGEEYGVFDRPGGLAGIWGKIIREVGGWVGGWVLRVLWGVLSRAEG